MGSFANELLPMVTMLVVEVTEAGLVTLSKAAISRGMSNFVFVVYCNALGTLILFPNFLIHFSSSRRPPLSFALLRRFFVLGLIGSCLLQMFSFAGIKYSTPTLSACIGNLIPAFTFLLAVLMGMEKLELRRPSGQAKCLGTVIAICGAFIVTTVKGPAILTPHDSVQSYHDPSLQSQESNRLLGGFLLLISVMLSSTWNVLQTATTKAYPDQVIIVFFFTLFGTIQSGVASFFLERNPEAWKIHNRVEIILIVYTAFAVTAFRYSVVTWCLHKKGPVYVAMYKPLSIVIAALFAFVFLGDAIYFGCLIGAIGIAAGAYTVIWGQKKEREHTLENGVDSIPSNCDSKTPLLETVVA